MIDECHASGFMGKTGRGTHEHHNVMGRIDIITGTLGKALGGAMGGFTAGRKESKPCVRNPALTCSRTRWRLQSPVPRWLF
jgi:7-keto-8-aminopelargonate synthetase-like enzyme